jgi:hypothetical protein
MIIGSTFKEAGFREYNAVRSWQMAFPRAMIVLFGEETKPLASELRTWTKEVKRCPDGAPYLSAMIRNMTNWSSPRDALLWINSDIILFPEARKHLEYFEAQSEPFLLTGQRWNIDVTGRLPDESLFSEAIGRTTFDNYMIYHSMKQEWLAYNMTQHVLALHQNHPESEDSRTGPQALANQALGNAAYPEWTFGWDGWVDHLPAPRYSEDRYD